MKQLTVVKLSSVHNVICDCIIKEGNFVIAYLKNEIVAGFSTEAVDEFYLRDVVVTSDGKKVVRNDSERRD